MTTIFFGWQPFFWSCHQILGDMIWWPTQDLVAVYTCSTGTGRVLGCRIGSAQWNHDTSYMHLREEKKKCTKFSTYRVYDSYMTAVWQLYDTCWPRADHARPTSPCTGFRFGILAACGGSTDCPTNWYPPYPAVWPASTWLLPLVLCMHACMTVTVNCPVSVFFVLLTKKFHVHILAAHNT